MIPLVINQTDEDMPPDEIVNLFLGRPDSWWMRTPKGNGCTIRLFPESFPRNLNLQALVNVLQLCGFIQIGDNQFYLDNAWKRENQGNKQAPVGSRPLWHVALIR